MVAQAALLPDEIDIYDTRYDHVTLVKNIKRQQ
jgi:hypothetical protein